MNKDFQIEVLYFRGCPNHEPAVNQVREALKAEAIVNAVEEIEVTDAAMAQEIRFIGSPSVRVNGRDVEEAARDAETFGFGCRTYFEENRRSGLPSVALIRRALINATSFVTSEGSSDQR